MVTKNEQLKTSSYKGKILFQNITNLSIDNICSKNYSIKDFVEEIKTMVRKKGLKTDNPFSNICKNEWDSNIAQSYIEYLLENPNPDLHIISLNKTTASSKNSDFYVLDGIQRLLAIVAFFRNEVLYKGYYLNEFEDKDIILNKVCVKLQTNCLTDYDQLLQWYIELNKKDRTYVDITKLKKQYIINTKNQSYVLDVLNSNNFDYDGVINRVYDQLVYMI